MLLVRFQFCVIFYAIGGAVLAISNDTITVSAVFAVSKDEAIAILRACFHMLHVESIFDLFVGVLQLPLFSPSHVCLYIQLEMIFITIPNGDSPCCLSFFPKIASPQICFRWWIISGSFLSHEISIASPCNRSRRREQGRRPCRQCTSTVKFGFFIVLLHLIVLCFISHSRIYRILEFLWELQLRLFVCCMNRILLWRGRSESLNRCPCWILTRSKSKK